MNAHTSLADKSASPTTDKVVDPVCGMQVDPASSAGSFEYKGTTYHFCGVRCLDRFKSNPESFLNRAEPKPPPDAASYACPMHPEIRQNHPGSCPKCGMALEPVAPISPASKTEYVCPMHPQIIKRTRFMSNLWDGPRATRGHPGRGPEPGAGGYAPVLGLPRPGAAPARPGDGGDDPGAAPGRAIPHILPWVELGLATPVVLWAGWPFFVRGWASIVNRSLNMFTLIALGTGVAYVYSLVAAALPRALSRIRSAATTARFRSTSRRRP